MSITREEFECIEIGDSVELNDRADEYSGQMFVVSGFNHDFSDMPRIVCKGAPHRAWPRSYIEHWHPASPDVKFISHEGVGLLELFGGSHE